MCSGTLIKDPPRREQPLSRKTFVHVEDPKTLCESLTWKYEDTLKKWQEADKIDQDVMNR